MKITLEQAVCAAQTAARLNAVRMNSSTTARKLFSIKKLLEENYEFYLAEERKLIDELGGTVQDNGAILFADQEEGLRKLKAGREELLKTEVEVAIDAPIIFREAEGVKVSGEEIGYLIGIAEFKD